MGLSDAWDQFTSGNFQRALDYTYLAALDTVTGDEDTVAVGNDVDKRTKDFNSTQDPYSQIKFTPFQQVVDDNSPTDAIVQSYKDQISRVSASLSGASGFVLWETLKSLRWFILVAAIIGIGYLYLGTRKIKSL